MNRTNHKLLKFLLSSWSVLFSIAVGGQVPAEYKGKPYQDACHQQGPQIIPGRIELAFYDLGGEGVAYHDTDPQNNGSMLNRTDGHCRPGIDPNICFFRESEGVDISYTKDWADFNHPNKVDPAVNQLYIGWQEDGEWTNYTVNIKVKGRYKLITIYGNQDNKASLWLDNEPLTTLLLPNETGNWHYWDQATIGEAELTQTGLHVLTLKYNKGANLAFIDFVLLEAFEEPTQKP